MNERVRRYDNGTGVRWDLLTSVPFLLSLGVLALNDFVLKGAYGNALTGKLSDFAGLFAFSLFLCAFVPPRRWSCVVLAGAWFTFWKSPLSQPLIDAWNGSGAFEIARVVDYGDLLALAVLPMSALLVARRRPAPAPRWPAYAMALIALVLFTATSRPRRVVPYDHRYGFDMPAEDMLILLERYRQPTLLEEYERPDFASLDPYYAAERHAPNESFSFWLVDNGLNAIVSVLPDEDGSFLRLHQLGLWSEQEEDDPTSMLTGFEEELVGPLRAAASDSLMSTAIRLTERPRRRPARWFRSSNEAIVFGLLQYAAVPGDSVALVFGSPAESDISIVPCEVRLERVEGGAWVDAGDIRGSSPCEDSRIALRDGDARVLPALVSWPTGVWRLAGTFRTEQGDTSLYTEPLIVRAPPGKGP